MRGLRVVSGAGSLQSTQLALHNTWSGSAAADSAVWLLSWGTQVLSQLCRVQQQDLGLFYQSEAVDFVNEACPAGWRSGMATQYGYFSQVCSPLYLLLCQAGSVCKF